MRNIFDQYGAPENRLTHALGSCLQRDRRLLRNFIRWVTKRRDLEWRRLRVIEQHIPGTSVDPATDGEASLPDLWIHGDGTWSLIVESKVMARVEPRQLARHQNMARRNGFTNVQLLVLTTAAPPHRLDGVICKTWPEVHAWSRRQAKESPWAACLAEYLEVAEARMAADEYLTEGTLTQFDGVPFGPDHPYTYREGKRVLKLAMNELRSHRELKKMILPEAPGRPAITGSDGASVWDLLRLRESRGTANFAAFPHLTLSIQERRILIVVSLPNAAPAWMRRNLTRGGFEGFRSLVSEVEGRVTKAIRKISNAYPFMEAVQKRYHTQRSTPVDDARLEIDIRTAAASWRSPVRIQHQWVQAAFDATRQKRSHLQLGIGAVLKYGDRRIHSREVLDVVAGVWIGCRPWIDTILEGSR